MSNLRQAAQQALEAMGTVGADWICEASHHAKKDQHKWGEPCPLQQRWHVAYQALRAALAEPHDPVAYDGWVLREVLFDNGEPVGHRAPEQEPVAWMDREGDLYKMPEIKNWAPPHKMLYTAPPQRKRFDILAITTAYEQGVGKGHQAHGRSVEIENPYAPGECQQAWALGYDEGKKQASPKVPHGIGEKHDKR